MTTKRCRPSAECESDGLLRALKTRQDKLEARNAELEALNEEVQCSNEALVISCTRFQTLYEMAPTPYVTVDAAYTVVDVNHAAELILDAPRDQLLGASIDQQVGGADAAGFRAFVDRVFATRHVRYRDLTLVRPDTTPIDLLIDGMLLPEAEDEPACCVLAFVDITARRLAETARRRAQTELLANISHDLRGPLSTIGLACNTLIDDVPAAEQRECVAIIERASARCERLIQDMISGSGTESGRRELAIERFDARDLVRQVCSDHASAVAAVSATLTVSVDDQPQLLVGDPARLHRVLSNLIGNALVHARGAWIEVSVGARAGDVAITVTDGGPGIPPEVMPTIFDRHRRGAHGGHGLGLAIVKELVEAHHGTATVTSPPGHGARFEVILPRAEWLAQSKP